MDAPLPLHTFIIIPSIFIAILLFTNIKYNLAPNDYFPSISAFPTLVIGFIFLYAMQKYDKMDANVPVVERNIIYLEEIALKTDPSLLCFLDQYVENFLTFTNDEFPILKFEKELLPQIEDETEAFRIREAVTTLELISHQRITKTNLIPDAIWYLVLMSAMLLTVIFPMDKEFKNAIDPILIIILIWLPLITLYYLYVEELKRLDATLNKLKIDLRKNIEKEGVKCDVVQY
tara:strand:+ start:1017 stop:1712 length:696 start_codon:yes stop_codon:yes gene_type:complete